MKSPKLETCPFLGPRAEEDDRPERTLPADYEVDPFKYLPPGLILSERDLDLAGRYERGDFSGGYIPSLIAYCRRGRSADEHAARREKLAKLRAEVERLGLILPDAFVALVECDDYVDRLRHENVRLRLPDEIVSLPSSPEHKLFLMFSEGQGCGYWHLLLAPGGGHIVTLSEHGFGLHNLYLKGYEPDVASFAVYQCAKSFSEWIVNFFGECVDEDRRHERALEQWERITQLQENAVKTLHFSILIHAPRASVWDTMLGADTYKQWTAVFCEGSYFEGSWNEGDRIRFLAPSGDGMTAIIAENRLHELLSIEHVGLVKAGVEDMESPEAENWEPLYENYTLAVVPSGTELSVDQDVTAEFEGFMRGAWPKALARLKELVESRQEGGRA